MPYQNKSGCVGSMVAGLKVSAPSTFPYLLLLICLTISIKRREEAEKTGTLNFFDSSKINFPSSKDAAKGLSMKSRFPALITSNACSLCRRPSLVSNKTTSTSCNNSAIELTILTPCFCIAEICSGIRRLLNSKVLLPKGYAATTL
ncbi:hypothetical protein D3C85_1171700 [compost metagenome]